MKFRTLILFLLGLLLVLAILATQGVGPVGAQGIETPSPTEQITETPPIEVTASAEPTASATPTLDPEEGEVQIEWLFFFVADGCQLAMVQNNGESSRQTTDILYRQGSEEVPAENVEAYPNKKTFTDIPESWQGKRVDVYVRFVKHYSLSANDVTYCPTPTPSPSPTATTTLTPTLTVTPTVTITPTASLTPTMTITPTVTLTVTPSPSPTGTWLPTSTPRSTEPPPANPTATPTAEPATGFEAPRSGGDEPWPWWAKAYAALQWVGTGFVVFMGSYLLLRKWRNRNK